VGEAQRSGAPTSGVPREATYREEEVWEGHKGEVHGGGSGERHRRLGQAAVGAWRHGNERENQGIGSGRR
jgi:hypothetical protein